MKTRIQIHLLLSFFSVIFFAPSTSWANGEWVRDPRAQISLVHAEVPLGISIPIPRGQIRYYYKLAGSQTYRLHATGLAGFEINSFAEPSSPDPAKNQLRVTLFGDMRSDGFFRTARSFLQEFMSTTPFPHLTLVSDIVDVANFEYVATETIVFPFQFKVKEGNYLKFHLQIQLITKFFYHLQEKFALPDALIQSLFRELHFELPEISSAPTFLLSRPLEAESSRLSSATATTASPLSSSPLTIPSFSNRSSPTFPSSPEPSPDVSSSSLVDLFDFWSQHPPESNDLTMDDHLNSPPTDEGLANFPLRNPEFDGIFTYQFFIQRFHTLETDARYLAILNDPRNSFRNDIIKVCTLVFKQYRLRAEKVVTPEEAERLEKCLKLIDSQF